MKKLYLFLIVFLLVGPSMYLISYLKTRENVSKQSFIDDDDKDVSKVEGGVSKQSFIDYDAKYVDPQRGFDALEDFKEVYKTRSPSIMLYECAGWEEDAGDFRKVQIQLENGNMVEFANLDGWVKLKAPIKSGISCSLPEQSQRVKKTPYFFTLDMGKGKYIMVLEGYFGDLTLIAVSPENAEIIFNQEFYLQEVLEEHNGYRLVVFISVQYEYGKFKHIKHEIVIRDGKLTFQEQKDHSLPKGTSP